MTYRDKIRQSISDIIRSCPEWDEAKDKLKKLRRLNPYRDRPNSHMSKIWLDECRYQLGLKKPKPAKPIQEIEGQTKMFTEAAND